MTDYYNQAILEGEKAFKDGVSIDQNPYKYDSFGANKAGWDRGWENENSKVRRIKKMVNNNGRNKEL